MTEQGFLKKSETRYLVSYKEKGGVYLRSDVRCYHFTNGNSTMRAGFGRERTLPPERRIYPAAPHAVHPSAG